MSTFFRLELFIVTMLEGAAMDRPPSVFMRNGVPPLIDWTNPPSPIFAPSRCVSLVIVSTNYGHMNSNRI